MRLIILSLMILLSGCATAPKLEVDADNPAAQTESELALCRALEPLPSFDLTEDSTQTQIEIALFGRKKRCLCGEAIEGDNCPDLKE